MAHFLWRWRQLVSLPMVAILPVSMLADDAISILHGTGQGVLVNHNPAPASIALYPNDLVETAKNTVAEIAATGSTTQLNPETLVEVENNELVLDHGGLSVITLRGVRVRVGCITVTPVNPAEDTRYQVVDLDGKVSVFAERSDVYIDEHSKNPQEVKKAERSSRSLVRQGERKSREEKCAGAYLQPPPGHVDAIGPIMNSPYAIVIALGVVAGLGCFALCTSDNPVSPSAP